eukprot:TRINITY_DN2457_c0_g3_i1.p1 TRINITY_DN2457_c0_g3~~TRINITY_DN2457_c0_g3_i1.p1  ORF type:complete len:1191 (-),score=436.75 TRINITY_DN2457_c0_g3_i1:57-3629(-)
MKKFTAVAQLVGKGRTPSADDSEVVNKQAHQLATTSNYLKDLTKKLENQSKSGASYIEAGRGLADTLRDYGMKISAESTIPLGTCLKTLADFQRTLEDMKADLNTSLQNGLTNPMRQATKGEIPDALEAEKKYEKAKGNYESSVRKVKEMNEKTKVNLIKITEAEQERDALKVVYDATHKESSRVLTEENIKVEFETLARLVMYFEAHYDFFEEATSKMNALMPEIEEYRYYVEQRMQEFEKVTGKAVERILSPKSQRMQRKASFIHPSMSGADLKKSNSGHRPTKEEADKKLSTLTDMLKSERIYLNSLRSIKENYLSALQKLQKSDPKIRLTDEDLNTLFGMIDELFAMHLEIFEGLDSALENYPSKPISEIFLKRMSGLQKYISYARNFSHAMETLSQLKKSRTLNNFIKSCEKNDTSNLTLTALLAVPLKRINQYEFWLESIFEAIPTTDPEYQTLEDTVDKIIELSEVVLQSNVKAGEMAQVMAVQKKLNGFDENLVEPDRHLILEAPLMMLTQPKGKEGKKVSNYHCFLFNDMLVYASKSGVKTRVTAARQNKDLQLLTDVFKYKGNIPVHTMTIHDLEDTETLKFAFQIISGKSAFTVCTIGAQEKQDWINAIQKALSEAEKRKVFGVPLPNLMKNSEQAGRSIPTFVEHWLYFIEKNGADNEGIFRLSGSAIEIEKMKDIYDSGSQPEMDGKDCHAIAGLFKLWLRELPEPLLTYDLYSTWVALSNIEESKKLEYAKSVVAQLPIYNKYMLLALIHHLAKIVSLSDQNKMGPSNLSIVFGPNILYKKNADMFDTAELRSVYHVVQFLIENHVELFAGIEEDRKRFEEREMKEIEERREKEISEREKLKQTQKQEKVLKEEKIKKEKEEKERIEREANDSVEREKDLERQMSQEEQNKKAKEEQAVRFQEREEREKARVSLEEREKQEREELEKKLKKEKKELRKRMKEKRQKEEDEYRKQREVEEKEYRKKREEERRKEEEEERRLREDRLKEIDRQRQIEEDMRKKLEDEKKKLEARLTHSSSANSVGSASPSDSPNLSPRKTMSPSPSSSSSTAQPSPNSPVADILICEICKEIIVGQGLHALGHTYHATCFVCTHCKNPLTGSFLHSEGKPYCVEDFNRLFAKTCAGCNKNIQGPFVKAMNREWHPSGCFVCSKCKGTLSGGFFEKDTKPFCKNCAHTT